MKWRWAWWRGGHDERNRRKDAEQRLERARNETPHVKKAAKETAEMPADEFADLVSRAFKPRRSG